MNEAFWGPVKLSIQVACVSTIVVIVIGTFAGYFMARRNFRFKMLLDILFLLPMVLPPTVIGFLLIVVFGKNSPIGVLLEGIFNQSIMFTWAAAVIASIIVSFPLMYQSTRAAFQKRNVGLEEAAYDLGASKLQVFIKVTLPLIFPHLLAGTILSFVRALGEFGATLMFAGNIPGKTQTIPTGIYMAIDSGNMGLAWSLVITTILFSSSFLFFMQYLNKKC